MILENINIVLAENIQKYRKEKNMTQKELAEKLGVTYQAVSKWENATSAPDIFFLPELADVYDCSIDELFSRTTNREMIEPTYKDLPWEDDDVIRGVVFHGHNILKATDPLMDKFTFEIIGDPKNVKSQCRINVKGNVRGNCEAGTRIDVGGGLTGNCSAGNRIDIGGGVLGMCNAGDRIDCGGGITGMVNNGGTINCTELRSKNLHNGGSITVSGNVRAKKVKISGSLTCNKLRCWRLWRNDE